MSHGDDCRQRSQTHKSAQLGRRHYLTAVGIGLSAVVGGCLGAGGTKPYEDGTVDNRTGPPRTAGEMVAASAVAEQETNDNVTPLEAISILEHDFVLEDNYLGATVQGVLENTGDERLELVEVRVRAYTDDGSQLGRYLSTTGDVDSGSRWDFTVVVLESPQDIGGYDIAAFGLQ